MSFHDQQTPERPTEAECWAEFWQKIAVIWAGLPPETQQAIIDDPAFESAARAGEPTAAGAHSGRTGRNR